MFTLANFISAILWISLAMLLTLLLALIFDPPTGILFAIQLFATTAIFIKFATFGDKSGK